MPGERISDYMRNYMRRPGGTSRRLGGQIGGFNTGRNQGPQGRDMLRAVGAMERMNRMRQRNPNRDWRTGHPMRRRRITPQTRSFTGGIRP